MHTRSKGNQHLIRYLDNIDRLPRASRVEIEQEEEVLMADNQREDLEHGGDDAVQRQPRYIGAGDAPNTHTQRQGIVPPPIQNNNFEIKHSLISMVQGNRFHGLPMEDPLDHLDEFDRLCDMSKMNGVSEDALKLRLFPFSLGDKAHVWERGLPKGSITTWEDCKKSFLAKFFSTSRTARLRNEISGFSQKSGESFSEAWERFKQSVSRCPHHGFSSESILSTLYRGVLPKFRMLLDTASNGNFMSKDIDEGRALVENLAQSDSTYGEDYDRNNRSSFESDERHRKEIKALNDKMDKLLQTQQKHVHFASEEEMIPIQDGEDAQLEEISYIQNQGGGYTKGFVNYKPNPNLSYRSTNVANPRDQVYPPQQQANTTNFTPYNQNQGYAPKQQYSGGYQQQQSSAAPPGFAQQDTSLQASIQQIFQVLSSQSANLDKQVAEIKTNMARDYNAIHTQIDSMTSRIQHLESKSASSSNQNQGHLPGKSIQNPKDYSQVNAITGCNLPAIQTEDDRTTLTVDSEIQDGEAFSPSESPFGSSYISIDHMTEPLAEELDQPTRSYSSSSLARSLDRVLQAESTDKTLPDAEEAPIILPPYVPKLPSPGRSKKELMEEYRTELSRQLLLMTDAAFLTKTLELVTPDDQQLKDALLERIKEIQSLKEAPNEVTTELPTRVIQMKLDDPGSFTLPCSLGPLMFGKCLCDLGASVNLMPLSVAQRLGFHQYKPSKVSLMLADRSVRHPIGLLENLPLRVGHVQVPTDFVVLDMDDEPRDPLILGRPFLATAGAQIDVKRGRIDLDFGEGLVLKFDIDKATERPTIDGQLYSIEDDKPGGDTRHGQMAWKEVLSENAVSKPLPTANPSIHSSSADIPSVTCKIDKGKSKEWAELKGRSKCQDQTIRSLMKTVKQLTSKVIELQGDMEVWHSELLRVRAKFGTQVERESNYPPDQEEFGIEEEEVERRYSDLSREDAEFEYNADKGTKRTLEPLLKPP